jgi:hypothetical protein
VFDFGVGRFIGEGRPIRKMSGVDCAGFNLNETNQTLMNKIVHHLGLDVH